MSWYESSMQVITEKYNELIRDGERDKIFIAKQIDNSYPFGERKMFPYKAWLRARKEFFSKYGLGKIPSLEKDDLFYQ